VRSKLGKGWRTSGNFGQDFVFNWNAIIASVCDVPIACYSSEKTTTTLHDPRPGIAVLLACVLNGGGGREHLVTMDRFSFNIVDGYLVAVQLRLFYLRRRYSVVHVSEVWKDLLG